MRTTRALLLAGAVLASLPAGAATLYVDDNCSPPSNGSSGDPFCTIQEGVDAANPAGGDTVRVRPGSYFECVDAYSGGVRVTIVADVPADRPLIDGAVCAGLPAVILPDGASLTGFTVTGGSDSGVLGFGSVAITNNVVQGNSAALSGGGIFVYSAALDYAPPKTINIVVQNNTVLNNVTNSDGGGIWVGAYSDTGIDAVATVSGNVVRNNDANGVGGGIVALTNAPSDGSAAIQITQNTIQGNTARAASGYGYGGGVWAATAGYGFETISVDANVVGAPAGSSDPALGNVAESNGGGISAWILAATTSDHAMFIENNTVRRNTADQDGGGIELLVQAEQMTSGRYTSLIANNTVGANSAVRSAGGILADVQTALTNQRRNPSDIAANTVTGNTAGASGGGIELRGLAIGHPFQTGAPTGPSYVAAAVRHNVITGNAASGAGAVGGGLSLVGEADGQAIVDLTASFNTVSGNSAQAGGGGIEITGTTIGNGVGNGTIFMDVSNSAVQNNTGFGIGGTPLVGPGALTLTVRSSDLSGNSSGDIEPGLPVLLACMPAGGAGLDFPDLNGDETVDGVDLLRIATSFASSPGAVHYNPLADLDGDLVVDGNDLAAIGAVFGDTCP
jgi:hypothetical protein